MGARGDDSRQRPGLAGGVLAHAGDAESLPAWSITSAEAQGPALAPAWPEPVSRSWAIGGATGEGIDVCIVDSGVDASHPLVGDVISAAAVEIDEEGDPVVVEDHEGDVCGHGTACAAIVRSIAPACRIHSVRVLGPGMTGSGDRILAGLKHAIAQGNRVVNLSLSTTKRRFAEDLHDLADEAYFRGALVVASAHNSPVDSFPWRFSSVVSVGSHEGRDPLTWYANATPPVELYARGFDVDVAWLEGTTIRATGNSFAAPHITAIAALALSKYPSLTPYALKTLLQSTAANVGGRP